MHDVLYGWKGGTNADRFPPELVRTLALGLRLDVAEFDACVRAPGTIAPVEEGLRDGFVMGAPRASHGLRQRRLCRRHRGLHAYPIIGAQRRHSLSAAP